jgi:hypothetical protein
MWYRIYRTAEFRITVTGLGVITHVETDFPQDVRIPEVWFEEGLLHIREMTATCSKEQVGMYEVTGAPGEYLIFTPVDDPCARSRNIQGMWTPKSQ